MDEHKEELATIESLDSGAVYTLALKTHVGMSIDTVRYFAGWADKIQVKYSKWTFSGYFGLLDRLNKNKVMFDKGWTRLFFGFKILNFFVGIDHSYK